MNYPRILSLTDLLASKSFFLLGPRATGKSSLIKLQLENKALLINLLQTDIYLRLSAHPASLRTMIAASAHKVVVIDEIQKIPALLDEVHYLIEEKGIRFLLTGSSARKLKRHDVNLLAGRAWQANLFPLICNEITDFNLERYLQYGGLPVVYSSPMPEEELHAYIDTYLREEIRAESFVRNIPAFSRFLEVSALSSGQIINFTNIARETAMPTSSVREYYHILEDTLLGFFVPAWTKSLKRHAITASKFFYFDIGVRNTIANSKALSPNSTAYGYAFEHFITLEIRAYLSYSRKRKSLSYWRTKLGHEVDLIIGDEVAIEIKSTTNINKTHTKPLKYLAQENILNRYIIVSQDPIEQRIDEIETMPWQKFLELLWRGQIV